MGVEDGTDEVEVGVEEGNKVCVCGVGGGRIWQRRSYVGIGGGVGTMVGVQWWWV